MVVLNVLIPTASCTLRTYCWTVRDKLPLERKTWTQCTSRERAIIALQLARISHTQGLQPLFFEWGSSILEQLLLHVVKLFGLVIFYGTCHVSIVMNNQHFAVTGSVVWVLPTHTRCVISLLKRKHKHNNHKHNNHKHKCEETSWCYQDLYSLQSVKLSL